MQSRRYGIVFLWVIFGCCAVGQPTASKAPVPQQDLPDSFSEEVERIEQDGWAVAPHELNNTDINNDGFSEIVIWKGCGGTAWSCQQIGIYQIRENLLIHLSEPIAGSLFPSSLVDLDQDGSLEIIAIETRWETYEHLPHTVAPSVEEIFAWSNGSYRKATVDYPEYYRRRISQIEARLDRTENPYDYLGDSIKLLLNYDRMGQTASGWKKFERLLQTERPSIIDNDVWRSLKDPILADFKKEFGPRD